jgi:hypothetical protein
VQRRIDHRSKRMEAYPPIDRKAQPEGAGRTRPGGPDTAGGPGAGGNGAAGTAEAGGDPPGEGGATR